jgi:hypothetical protein
MTVTSMSHSIVHASHLNRSVHLSIQKADTNFIGMTLNSVLVCICILLRSRESYSWSFLAGESGVSRRHFIHSLPAVGFALLPSTATALDPSESIRQTASSLPGYGPADVYYPQGFQGSWRLRREVVVGDKTTLDIAYPVRFLPSIQDDPVVADRGFNQMNLENSLLAPDSVQSYDWNESNPNDLHMVFKSGKTKDLKVTKRATERTDTTISSSEFQRVVTQESFNGIPQISARRVLTKWKADENGTTWKGLELVYEMGGGGDPMSLTTLSNSQQQATQVLLSKSRLTLTRE